MMRATIKVRMRSGEPWRPGLLTTERAESSYGLPVVIVKGTAYGAAEVWSIYVSPRAAAAARAAG